MKSIRVCLDTSLHACAGNTFMKRSICIFLGSPFQGFLFCSPRTRITLFFISSNILIFLSKKFVYGTTSPLLDRGLVGKQHVFIRVRPWSRWSLPTHGGASRASPFFRPFLSSLASVFLSFSLFLLSRFSVFVSQKCCYSQVYRDADKHRRMPL